MVKQKRELREHQVGVVNNGLTITVDDEPGSGNAHHRYVVTGFNAATNPGHRPDAGQFAKVVLFQNGPVSINGANGLTNEALLAIVADRLQSFQAGKFACGENEAALTHVRNAIETLHCRTRARMARMVEGTHTP
jgi:hypothetical protein